MTRALGDPRVLGDLCRLTVVAPTGRADLAVPSGMPVRELLPMLVRHADPGQAAVPPDRHGWALQRAGEDVLDVDGTPDSLGLRDGDVLYLRPAELPLPPIHFDDLADGVAAAVRQGADRWRPELTRYLFLAAAGGTLAVLLAGLLLAGPAMPRAVLAGAVAVLLTAAGTVCSRAFGEPAAAVLLGLAAVPFGSLCGLLLTAAVGPGAAGPGAGSGALGSGAVGSGAVGSGAAGSGAAGPRVPGVLGFAVGAVDGPAVLAAAAAGLLIALLGLVLVAACAPLFVCVAGTLTGTAVAGVLMTWLDLSAVRAAAVLAVAAFGLGVFAPNAATRLARLRLPHLPADEHELQEDIDPAPGREVLARSARAGNHLDALCGTAGLLCAGSFAVVAPAPGWAPPALVAVLSVAMLLRSRLLAGSWQRVATVFAGSVGVAALALTLIAGADPAGRPPLLLGLGLAAGPLVFAARYLPERRLQPFWGRAADVGETALGLVALPLVLQVLHVYAWARSLAG